MTTALDRFLSTRQSIESAQRVYDLIVALGDNDNVYIDVSVKVRHAPDAHGMLASDAEFNRAFKKVLESQLRDLSMRAMAELKLASQNAGREARTELEQLLNAMGPSDRK